MIFVLRLPLGVHKGREWNGMVIKRKEWNGFSREWNGIKKYCLDVLKYRNGKEWNVSNIVWK